MTTRLPKLELLSAALGQDERTAVDPLLEAALHGDGGAFSRLVKPHLSLLPQSAVPPPRSPPGAVPAGSPPPRVAQGTRAFYTIFEPMLRSPDWPSAYEEYRGGVVVMQPFNATREVVETVRKTLDVKVLMYFDSTELMKKMVAECAFSHSANWSCRKKEPYCVLPFRAISW